MTLPIYELKINENENADAEVSFVALVDAPAIKKNFIAFKEEFVHPGKGESKDDFLNRCIPYMVKEGKDADQAVAICQSMWSEKFNDNLISFDFDDTLTTERGKKMAAEMIAKGFTVYVISARSTKDGMMDVCDSLDIPAERVFAMGSNAEKVAKIKELNIGRHYDNNPDVISELGSVGVKFSEPLKFSVVNEEQRIITGPLMLADELIYRNNEKLGEHYVKFSADTIKKIAIKFAKKKYQTNVNLMHDGNQQVDGVTMFESWLVDKQRGVKPMADFSEVPDGSWFGSFYVENDDVWAQIKEGGLRGYSVEGIFEYEEPISAEENALRKIGELLNELCED